MIDHFHHPAELQGRRWKALVLGLRLANNNLGIAVMACFYILWMLIGVALCFVLIPMAITGKADAFNQRLNPIALYGLVIPLGLIAAATWGVKFFSRLLWCAIPEPLMATFLALASVGGRLSVLIGAFYLWLQGVPWGRGLLLPEVVTCAGIAWLGLVADWGFIRALQQEFFSAVIPAQSAVELDNAEVDVTKDERVTEPSKSSMLKQDVGEWFKRRFPRSYKFLVWIVFPVGYVAMSSMAENGDPRAVPEAILRLSVIAPVMLQIFWTPSDKIAGLIHAFTQTSEQENVYST